MSSASLTPARAALLGAVRDFRQLAQREADQLALDVSRSRDRGYPRLAADLDAWRVRLTHLVQLADGVLREPGVPH